MSPPTPPPLTKNGSCFNVLNYIPADVLWTNLFHMLGHKMIPIYDNDKRYTETVVIMKIRAFKHDSFFSLGVVVGGGGGLYK